MKKRKHIILLILLVLSLIFVGCKKKVEPPTIPVNDDKIIDKMFIKPNFSIYLTSEYQEMDLEGYLYTFTTQETIIAVFVEDRPSLTETYGEIDVDKYIELFVAENKKEAKDINYGDDFTTFVYLGSDEANPEVYYTAIFMQDAYIWVVQFGCYQDQWEKYEPLFVKYAKSIKIS